MLSVSQREEEVLRLVRTFGGTPFELVGSINPERNEGGAVIRFLPQSRYRNTRQLLLNKHGAGPFCRFKVRGAARAPGVYLILVSGEPAYVGKCINLVQRFGSQGYGAIQPKNCFVGGQSTNCKVNHLILEEAERRSSMELWFHATPEPGPVERAVILSVTPPWNDQVPW